MFLVTWPAVAQVPFVPPPPPAPIQPDAVPNAANPNQRLKTRRPNAPGPDEYIVIADTEETDGSLRHLRGHVHLETTDKKLEADEVDYDEDTGDAEFRGNVRYENYVDGTKLNCDHGTYNINSETGLFYDLRGTSVPRIISRPGLLTTNNPFYFEGKWAERKEDRYIVHDGFVTDCKVPKPWWRLTGPKFDIVPGNRAIAYHAVFHVKRLPLFYLPAYYKSLKKLPRESGFLEPSFGRSTLFGEFFGLGYFWAINRSSDLLYRGVYYSLRGLASTVDFRYKVKPGTDIGFYLYGVNDKEKQGGFQFTLNGRSDLGHGWEAIGQVNYLSSFLFRQSFSQSFHDAIYSESHSVGFITKHWDTFGFYVVADRDEEFQSVTPDDKIVIRKLPEVEFLSRDRQIVGGVLPLWFSFDSSAGLLDRTEQDFQTRRFVPRVDVNPRVTTAFHFGGFSLTPSFAIRETAYGSSEANGQVSGDNVVRNAREIRLELMFPSLERIYKSPKWLGGEKVKHVIEARAEYVLVGGVDNFNRIIRFDGTDLLSDTNQVTLSITNRLFVKNKDGNVNEVLSWDLSQARYFDPTFGGAVIAGQRNVVASSEELDGFAFLNGPRNYSPVVSALRFQQKLGLEWRVDYDPLLGHISNTVFSADYRFSKYLISVGHSEVRTDPNVAPNSDQIRALLAVGNQNRKGWNAAVSIYYDYMRGILEFATTEITYNTDCCGISVEYRRFNFGTRDDSQYKVAFAISNVGTFGTLRKQERIY
ncbi:MAG TPA: LPS assembly protein LptD [Bryobacteraceae bacterium]|jgi:LPS-assembly protein|nr:LPS assembly protein LptD [Bryobacteraceae bacterium]